MFLFFFTSGEAARISTHPKLSLSFCNFLREQTFVLNKTSKNRILDYCLLDLNQKKDANYPFKKIDGVDIADEFIRNYTFEVTFWIIFILVIGFAFRYGRLLYHDTLTYFLRNWYNLFGLLSMILYMLYIVFVMYSRARVGEAIDYFNRTPTAWRDLLYTNDSEAMKRWSYIPADRRLWSDTDLGIIGEICFSVACLSMFLSFFSFFIANEHIGPLVISLVRMGGEMIRFSILLVMSLLSFILIFLKLYMSYAPQNREVIEVDFDVKKFAFGEEGGGGFKFGSFMSAFRTLFWGTFGMADYFDVELGGQNNANLDYRTPTVYAGYIMFGVYHWATVILLINMLIAMMTRSYDRIASDEDIEWKYARTKLYLDYMQTDTLCVPFNVIPTVKTFIRIINVIAGFCCPVKRTKFKNSFKRSTNEPRNLSNFFNHVDNETDHNLNYSLVMQRLINRYWSSKSTKFDEETKLEREIPKREMNDSNSDISSIKRDLNRLSELIKHKHLANDGVVNDLINVRDIVSNIESKYENISQNQTDLKVQMENFSCNCPCWELEENFRLYREDLRKSDASLSNSSRLVGIRLVPNDE